MLYFECTSVQQLYFGFKFWIATSGYPTLEWLFTKKRTFAPNPNYFALEAQQDIRCETAVCSFVPLH